jgi:hypothetical protein
MFQMGSPAWFINRDIWILGFGTKIFVAMVYFEKTYTQQLYLFTSSSGTVRSSELASIGCTEHFPFMVEVVMLCMKSNIGHKSARLRWKDRT